MNNTQRLQIARNNLSLARAEYGAVLKDRMWLHARIKDAKFHLRNAEVSIRIAEDKGIVNEDVLCKAMLWIESIQLWMAILGPDSHMIWPASEIETVYDKTYDKE